MEGSFKELDKVNEEMEKLKAKFQNKAELLDSLKIAYNEQLNRNQEAKDLIEKQTKELNAKSTEIYETRGLNENLNSKLQEKEMIVRKLTAVNEGLQVDFAEKVQNLEGENKRLQMDLDEAITIKDDLEQNNCAFIDQIAALKRLLCAAEKKGLEAEQMVQTAKELKSRHESIEDLEEKYQNVQDQLKWKKEQFQHLEEAHSKLQAQFTLRKDEWESEKSALLEEISSLQTNLDSQARISEGLQTQLRMCNQALAHEESKRKLLEVQLLEEQSRFEDIHVKCEEAQSQVGSLTVDREEDVANLRNLLGTKDVIFKEMELKITYLEQENREMHASLKELQESQINNAGAASSVDKLRKKLRGVEQIHSSCSKILKQKESEWSKQSAKMSEEMRSCLTQLDTKESHIHKLQEDLKEHESSLDLLCEEMAMVLIVLKSEFAEAYSKLLGDIKQKSRKLALLTKRVELELPQMEEELKRQEILLDESSRTQHKLEAQILHLENTLKDVSIDLEITNSELNNKVSENCLLEFEMHKWKSFAECEHASLDENKEAHKEAESSLLACVKAELKKENERLTSIVKEQEMTISDLQETLISQETTSAARSEEVETFKQTANNQFRIMQENESALENLQKEIAGLELESITRELEGAILATTNAERSFDHKKNTFLEIIEEKERTIESLQKEIAGLELESITGELEGAILATTNAEINFDQKNNMFLEIIEEKERTTESLQKEIAGLELESITRELKGAILATTNAERNFDNKKNTFLEIIEEKERTIESLQLWTRLLDEEFTQNLKLSFAEVTEKLIVVQALDEANHFLKVEIQERIRTITELENNAKDLQQKFDCQEDLLCTSKQHTQQLEKKLEVKTADLEELEQRFSNEKRQLEVNIEELKFEKRTLLEDFRKLSREKENILAQLDQDCDRMNELCYEDAKMMGMLRNIMQACKEDESNVNVTEENAIEGLFSSPKKAKERSALREINY